MKQHILDDMAAGNPDAIAVVKKQLSPEMSREEIVEVLTYAIEGMVNQSSHGEEGMKRKLGLLSICVALNKLFESEGTEAAGMLAEAKRLDGIYKEGEKPGEGVLLDFVHRLSAFDNEALAAQYDLCGHLNAMALIGPDSDMAGMNANLRDSLKAVGDRDGFGHTISAGAAVARAQDGEIMIGKKLMEVAKKCLLNMAFHGDERARRYAVEALALFKVDADVKEGLVSIAERDSAVTEAAGESLKTLREHKEATTLYADRLSLLSIEYPKDSTSPMIRSRLEMTFQAAETVLTKLSDGNEREVEEAVKQLTTVAPCLRSRQDFQISITPIDISAAISLADILDQRELEEVGSALDRLTSSKGKVQKLKTTLERRSLGLVRRNVENALIHAFVNGDGEVRETAKAGLIGLGSENVLYILRKISDREWKEGQRTETGTRVKEVFQEIQFRRNRQSAPPPPPDSVRMNGKSSRPPPPPRNGKGKLRLVS